MRIKYLVLNILIPVCFVAGLYSIYLCVGSVRKHKNLLQYEPAKPPSIQLVDSLEDYRQRYRNMRLADAPPDVVMKVGEINYAIDSITHSDSYIAELERYQVTYQKFLRHENKLTIKYIFQVVLVVLGLGGSIYFSKRFYTLFKSKNS